MKLGPWEIGLILLIVILIFGVGKLPQVGKDLGRAIRGFRQAASSGEDDQAVSKAEQKKVDATSEQVISK